MWHDRICARKPLDTRALRVRMHPHDCVQSSRVDADDGCPTCMLAMRLGGNVLQRVKYHVARQINQRCDARVQLEGTKSAARRETPSRAVVQPLKPLY
jgi:hypothetical protein